MERLGELARAAPSLADRMELAKGAAARYETYRSALSRLGAGMARDERITSLSAVAAAIDEARKRTATDDWWEGLAAAGLGAALSDGLFAALTDPADRADDTDVEYEDEVEDRDAMFWATRRLRAAVGDDPALAARLALWSRRLVGEVIVLAKVFGGEDYPRLAAQMAADHVQRLAALGFDE
jgi:hypothetical protein